jgi:hypothetical protein
VVERLADRDAAIEQFLAGGVDVGNDQVQALGGAGRRRGDVLAEDDRGRRAGRRELDDAEVVAGSEVSVEPPAQIAVELSFTKAAEAISRIFPTMARLIMPRGMIDYARNISATDVTFIAETNFMAVRKEVHPAVIDLLVRTMLEAHSAPDLYQKAGEFPTQTDPEFPMAESAVDYYKNGPSFLNRYLPSWVTGYLQRFAAVLTTVVAIAIPLFSFAPKLYRGLVQHRLMSLYRRLRAIEASLHKEVAASNLSLLETELASVNRAVHLLGVPMQHSDLFFNIKSSLDIVRINIGLRREELRNRIA